MSTPKSHLMSHEPTFNVWDVRKKQNEVKIKQLIQEEKEREEKERGALKARIQKRERNAMALPGSRCIHHLLSSLKDMELEDKERELKMMIPLMVRTMSLAHKIGIDLEERRWCREGRHCRDRREGHLVHWEHGH